MILGRVKQDEKHDDDGHGDGNSGTMIVDAICAPSNIRSPQDASLRNLAAIDEKLARGRILSERKGDRPAAIRTLLTPAARREISLR